jgi:hypothetical protein
MPGKKMFEKVGITSAVGERLEALLMMPAHGGPKRLVYIVPLMGSGAVQQILRFKSFSKRGSAILSFEYRGHGRSSGTFSLEKSLEDSKTVLQWAQEYAESKNIPLHVHATCYGNMAMLSWFKEGQQHPRGVKTLSAVSGILELNHIIKLEDFLSYYAHCNGTVFPSAAEFIADVEQGTIDVDGGHYRNALRDYLQGLFPELHVTPDAFEELEYRRVDMREMVKQFYRLRPSAGIEVPDDIPCLFFYGVNDGLLGLNRPEGRKAYEARLRAAVPRAEIRGAAVDHFGRGEDRDRILNQLCDYFEENDDRRAASAGVNAPGNPHLVHS